MKVSIKTVKAHKKRHFGSIDDEHKGLFNIVKAELLLAMNIMAEAGITKAPAKLIASRCTMVSIGYITKRANDKDKANLIDMGLITKHPFIHEGQLCLAYSLAKDGRDFIKKMPAELRERLEAPLRVLNADLINLKDQGQAFSATECYVHDDNRIANTTIVNPENNEIVVDHKESHFAYEIPADIIPAPEPAPQPIPERHEIPIRYLCYLFEGRESYQNRFYIADLNSDTLEFKCSRSIDNPDETAAYHNRTETAEAWADIKAGKFRLVMVNKERIETIILKSEAANGPE